MIAIEPPRSVQGSAAASAVAVLVAASVGVLAPLGVDLQSAALHALAVTLLMSGLTLAVRLTRETK